MVILVSSLNLANQSFAVSYNTSDKIIASDGKPYDLFGHAVSVSGNTLVVGAPSEGNNNEGKVYVFKRNLGTNTWNEVQKNFVKLLALIVKEDSM